MTGTWYEKQCFMLRVEGGSRVRKRGCERECLYKGRVKGKEIDGRK